MNISPERKREIEKISRSFLKDVYDHRNDYWRMGAPPLLQMLDVEILCQAAGYEYHESPGIPQTFPNQGQNFKIVGLLDTQRSRIIVDGSFPRAEVRFTTAHEIGHSLLHANRPNYVPHRERPIKDSQRFISTRDVEEQEADYFAACTLMPAGLVKEFFIAVFGKVPLPIKFNDHLAQALSPDDPGKLLYASKGTLDRALALASFRNYQSGIRSSLAEVFRVSNTAMAYRLIELGYLDWP